MTFARISAMALQRACSHTNFRRLFMAYIRQSLAAAGVAVAGLLLQPIAGAAAKTADEPLIVQSMSTADLVIVLNALELKGVQEKDGLVTLGYKGSSFGFSMDKCNSSGQCSVMRALTVFNGPFALEQLNAVNVAQGVLSACSMGKNLYSTHHDMSLVGGVDVRNIAVNIATFMETSVAVEDALTNARVASSGQTNSAALAKEMPAASQPSVQPNVQPTVTAEMMASVKHNEYVPAPVKIPNLDSLKF
jgi:hypothetical protein